MVDRLKDALEHLETPICLDCHVGMRWFRSELVADNPISRIAHLFVCPNCKRAERTDTKFTPAGVPPAKASAPRFRGVASEIGGIASRAV
ncbi:hypothetical protein AB8Z38_06830 [Bradyrhizobium sp. LLZ17]|jgi:hypothetical protein|uniref:Uncharacterized protein n=1 Tax=Bradyrhizobium sp. LLZ17 TaxID=3239388 RepID=A0AB39XS65_9BRAD